VAKYRVKTVPELPDNNPRIVNSLLRKVKKDINSKLQPAFNINFQIYSPSCIEDMLVFEDVELDNVKYMVTIVPDGFLDSNCRSEQLNFFGRIFKMALKGLRFNEIQRNLYNVDKAVQYNKHKLEIWPGFFSSVNLYSDQIFINVDLSFKVLRQQSALEYFRDLQNNQMPLERIKDEMIGSTVMTTYNKRMYRIDDITYDVKLSDTFTMNKGNGQEQVSYLQYYKDQYNVNINDKKQFLIRHVDRKTKREIYLIPECCYMTGLTDQMRSDFNLMKDIAQTTKCNPSQRLTATRSLISDLQNPKYEKAYEIIKNWQI
jgi:aubergine-like protein